MCTVPLQPRAYHKQLHIKFEFCAPPLQLRPLYSTVPWSTGAVTNASAQESLAALAFVTGNRT
jgi:hypothetical protein